MSSTGRSCRNSSYAAGGIDDDQPIGLGHLRGNFRQSAWCVPRRPRSAGQAPPARGAGSPARCRPATEEMGAARHVGEGLVDGDPLDEGREIAEHLDGGVAQPLVVLEMAADKDEVRNRVGAPAVRACRRALRRPWLRRKRRARPRHRRRSACRARTGRAAARPRHRRRRGPHEGWWPSYPSRMFIENKKRTSEVNCQAAVARRWRRRLASQVKRISSVRR